MCGFEVNVDGDITKGKVQGKHAARATYHSAVQQGNSAQLLEQMRADVFQMSVGNLLPGASVIVKITYVADLKIDEGAVRFLLPTHISPRFHPTTVPLGSDDILCSLL